MLTKVVSKYIPTHISSPSDAFTSQTAVLTNGARARTTTKVLRYCVVGAVRITEKRKVQIRVTTGKITVIFND
jgi:hypothetical protein